MAKESHPKKSRIRETKYLLTDADSSTNTKNIRLVRGNSQNKGTSKVNRQKHRQTDRQTDRRIDKPYDL